MWGKNVQMIANEVFKVLADRDEHGKGVIVLLSLRARFATTHRCVEVPFVGC